MMRLFSGYKALFQIGDDIVDMFRADRQADRIRFDPLIQQLFGRELGMGRGRGMDHERFHVGDIGEQGEDLQMIDEFVRFFLAALDLEGEDRSAAVREILFIERVLRMIRQRGVVDLSTCG